jgi:hypothetical protein
MLLNNGFNNYTLDYKIGEYTATNGFQNAIAYEIPTIDCIDRDIPYNLTIKNLCHDCTFSNTAVYGYKISLIGGPPGTKQQNRTVFDINRIKRPQRWENYTNCISETYKLEKSDWYGNGTLQVTAPGTYQFTITMNNPDNSFQYNFTINKYCTDGTNKPIPVPSPAPTIPPNERQPQVLNNISNLIAIYQPLRIATGDGSWNELHRFNDSYYIIPCIRRNATVTIKLMPDLKLPYGPPLSVSFTLYQPSFFSNTTTVITTNYTRTELLKPYLLYSDNYDDSATTTNKVWYGQKWIRTGNYTLVIRTDYKDKITIVDTKIIDVKRSNVICSLNSNINIFYPQ